VLSLISTKSYAELQLKHEYTLKVYGENSIVKNGDKLPILNIKDRC
jgi:hypothetical protein